MAKNLKLNIKNAQIAEAINLSGLKSKLAKKKESGESKALPEEKKSQGEVKEESDESPKEEAPRIRARSKSAFAEPHPEASPSAVSEPTSEPPPPRAKETPSKSSVLFDDDETEELPKTKTSAELRKDIFGDQKEESKEVFIAEPMPTPMAPPVNKIKEIPVETPSEEPLLTQKTQESKIQTPPIEQPTPLQKSQPKPPEAPKDKLGPTGRHIKDYYKPKPVAPQARTGSVSPSPAPNKEISAEERSKIKPKVKTEESEAKSTAEEEARKTQKPGKFKEFKDVKPTRKVEQTKQFDARDRQGLRASDDDQQWRRKRKAPRTVVQEDTTIRPTQLKVRLPISIKDLAVEMKLKASQLISKLFLQGVILTLNDLLEDETTVQLLGHEFGCEITIDTSEEQRIRITDQTIKEELLQSPQEELQLRPPVVAFMGHVDHGKTSLIDAIRKSNRASGEAGAITQHIGAFRCKTDVGDLAILDTPGHEAFSAMRARGADVTDIVVLVVAGDEGLRQQTIEAIQHARAAGVIMVVAINKCDKPNFNADNVYRQLAEQDLLPEVWGGQLITVNCSAVSGEGIKELLEMLALQAEVLELKANPNTRARGTVLESEMHKGMGAVATVLIQNGTLKRGDALVFGQHWGRVKTMHNEYGKELQEAGPSTPVEITGLSGLPEAGQEFIVVKNEKEARDISSVRSEGLRQSNLLLQQKKKTTMENLFQQASSGTGKKILNIVLRADVQGSLEALKAALLKIESDKADLNIIFTGIGEVSESDVQLAAASKAVILGFHTQIESHADPIVRQHGVQVRLHNIIYHAVDDIKGLLAGLLEKLPQETERGKAVVKATFKSSHAGIIAGCQVTEGVINRNHYIRVRRGNEIVWKGTISSLKRVKEDVREVQKGVECGIIPSNFSDIKEDDIIEAYDVTYITQEL